MSGLPCNPEDYMDIVEIVMREDLEGLARTFSTDERLEFWNEIREAWRRYIRQCAPKLPPAVDKLVRGKFRFAQLLLAASFRLRGEDYPHITGMFREEEYRLLEHFESLKELDHYSVEDIVEFIRTRRGRVYEIVMNYYKEQLHLFDEKWGPLMGDLAKVFSERYKERRRKIEDAVVEYTRRHGLLTTISEIEDAVKKVVEAGDLRRRIEEEVRAKVLNELGLPALEEKLGMLEEERRRLLERVRELEERILEEKEEKSRIAAELERLKAEKGSLAQGQSMLEQRLREAEERLREAMEELARKEEELRRLAEEKSSNRAAVETLTAEAETLRRLVEEYKARAEEYREALERLRTERDMVESRLQELESALRGETEGHLVTEEDARAMENAMVSRIRKKLGDGAVIYDPIAGKAREVKWSRVEYVSIAEEGDGLPRGRGIVLEKKKGLLRRKREIVVEAINLVHRDAFKEKGWDSRPVSLSEVLDLLEARIDQAEKGGYYHLLVVSSPTGFTRKAIEYLDSDSFHRNFTAKHVTLYLVDPVTGSVYYNRGDEAAEANREIAEPLLPEERVRRVIDYLESDEARNLAYANSPVAPFIRLDQIARKTGEPAEVVRRAIALLEAQGKGRVMATENTVAFFYKTGR